RREERPWPNEKHGRDIGGTASSEGRARIHRCAVSGNALGSPRNGSLSRRVRKHLRVQGVAGPLPKSSPWHGIRIWFSRYGQLHLCDRSEGSQGGRQVIWTSRHASFERLHGPFGGPWSQGMEFVSGYCRLEIRAQGAALL